MRVEEFANQVIEECESTNDLARQLGEAGMPHGSWVSARRQTRGRGRLGREWISQEGNLYLSIVLRVPETRDWTWIPILSALTIAKALNRQLNREEAITVKWPNDLWIGTAKTGGILCEGVSSRNQGFVVMGLGLNCAAAPEIPGQKVTSLARAFPETSLTAELLRPILIREITQAVATLAADRAGALADAVVDYARLTALKPGSAIQWSEGRMKGRVIGLGDFGELNVESSAGTPMSLYAEDVSVRPDGS